MYDNQVLLPGHFKGARIPGEAILVAQRRRHKLVWLHDRCLRGRTHATITVPDISTPRNGHPATGYMNGRVTKALVSETNFTNFPV